ncbi:YorP protein [Phage vB_KsaM-C1]|nr:YorP protein [Phage vB_KsaM-C1]
MDNIVENKFETGDIVMLRSGGPELTVIDTDRNHTQVAWFAEYTYREAVIHQRALVKL